VVKLLTHNIKVKGLSHVTASSRIEKMAKKGFIMPVCGGSAMVKLMTHNPIFKGSNPVTTSTNIEKTVKVL
jgi:hypothetical protein